jgi:hypothetical protein
MVTRWVTVAMPQIAAAAQSASVIGTTIARRDDTAMTPQALTNMPKI